MVGALLTLLGGAVSPELGSGGAARCSTGPAPEPPVAVRCFPSIHAAHAVWVSGRVQPTEVDFVSIELGLTADKRARVHLAASVDPSGTFDANVPISSLEDAHQRMSGTGFENATFRVSVRAHLRHCAEDGGAFSFSKLTGSDFPCQGSDGTIITRPFTSSASRSSSPPPSPKPKTTWLEVFRMTEMGRMLPDFLDNHDSGDLGGEGVAASLFLGIPQSQHQMLATTGSVGGLSGIRGRIQRHLFQAKDEMKEKGKKKSIGFEAMTGVNEFSPTLWTRYCVEILDSFIPNTTTTTFHGSPTTSTFADYRSMNPWSLIFSLPPLAIYFWAHAGEVAPGAEYGSWCDVAEDRAIGHLSRENILGAYCVTDTRAPDYQMCLCSSRSAAASRFHTGMMPIGLPIYLNPVLPGIYPGEAAGADPVGRWFSHPSQGRCPMGAPVGSSGCTWQRHPLAHSLYPADMFAYGFNDSTEADAGAPGWHQDEAKTKQNIAAFRAAIQNLKVPSCGQFDGQMLDEKNE